MSRWCWRCDYEEVSSAEERDHVHEHLLAMARNDSRITSAAVVGSLARGQGDQWSDVDLTFGVGDEIRVDDVLQEWTTEMVSEFDAVHVLDLRADAAIYRVFLLPSGLQVDISFAPQADFAATSRDFRLLFGSAKETLYPPPSADDIFGWGVLYALHARSSIERQRYWQARYFISNLVHHGLDLACLRLSLPTYYGKGYDALPEEVRDRFTEALTTSLEPDDLRVALRRAVAALLDEALAAEIDRAVKIDRRLRGLFSL